MSDWIENYGKEKGWVAKRIEQTNSLTVSARTGARELVAAVKWLTENGYEPTTRSEIVGLCVKVVASQVKEDEWPTVDRAHEFLDTHFSVLTKRRGKLVRNARIKDPQIRKEAYEAMNTGRDLENSITPFMTNLNGTMYIVHGDIEGVTKDKEKYKEAIENGRMKVVTLEEWEQLS